MCSKKQSCIQRCTRERQIPKRSRNRSGPQFSIPSPRSLNSCDSPSAGPTLSPVSGSLFSNGDASLGGSFETSPELTRLLAVLLLDFSSTSSPSESPEFSFFVVFFKECEDVGESCLIIVRIFETLGCCSWLILVMEDSSDDFKEISFSSGFPSSSSSGCWETLESMFLRLMPWAASIPFWSRVSSSEVSADEDGATIMKKLSSFAWTLYLPSWRWSYVLSGLFGAAWLGARREPTNAIVRMRSLNSFMVKTIGDFFSRGRAQRVLAHDWMTGEPGELPDALRSLYREQRIQTRRRCGKKLSWKFSLSFRDLLWAREMLRASMLLHDWDLTCR